MFFCSIVKASEQLFKTTIVANETLADAWISANNPGGQGVVTSKRNMAPETPQSLRKAKREFGEKMIDKISLINDGKDLTTAEVDAFMQNALISNLREHLWAGNITTFIDKLNASDVSAFFSSGEKAQVISECQAFLTSLGE